MSPIIIVAGCAGMILCSSSSAALMYFSNDSEGDTPPTSNTTPTVEKNSSYIKSAMYKCGGYAEVDVTTWFKTFVDTVPSGDDKSKYLCSTGGKYASACSNGGGYPGSHSVFNDDKLYEAAKAAGSGTVGSGCDSSYHHVVVTGNNGATATWSWGSYLDLSKIIV
jgi:hypothetical protein